MKFYGVGSNTGKLGFITSEFKDSKWQSNKAYSIWSSMIKRCYKDGGYVNYKSVTVSTDWLDYQDFALWYNMQPDHRKVSGWNLDKDILSTVDKIYSPDTSALVPLEINLSVKSMAQRDECQGVSWHNKDLSYGAYVKTINGKRIEKGGFKTVEAAFSWYKVNKEQQLKVLAEKYKHLVDTRVYEALLLMEV